MLIFVLRVTLVEVIYVVGFKLEEVLVLAESGINVSSFSSPAMFITHPLLPH